MVDAPCIHWSEGKEIDIFKPEVKIAMQKWKDGQLKEVPPNYHDDVMWSLEYLGRAMRGEPIPQSRTIRPSTARGDRGLLNGTAMGPESYEHSFLKATGFSSVDRSANAAVISFCGNLEDMQEMQRILSLKAEPYNGCKVDLTADTPERKRRKAEELECPGTAKKGERTTPEAELADDNKDMEEAW
eukprot:3717437-Pyramimonas_sp.AAC.1